MIESDPSHTLLQWTQCEIASLAITACITEHVLPCTVRLGQAQANLSNVRLGAHRGWARARVVQQHPAPLLHRARQRAVHPLKAPRRGSPRPLGSPRHQAPAQLGRRRAALHQLRSQGFQGFQQRGRQRRLGARGGVPERGCDAVQRVQQRGCSALGICTEGDVMWPSQLLCQLPCGNA